MKTVQIQNADSELDVCGQNQTRHFPALLRLRRAHSTAQHTRSPSVRPRWLLPTGLCPTFPSSASQPTSPSPPYRLCIKKRAGIRRMGHSGSEMPTGPLHRESSDPLGRRGSRSSGPVRISEPGWPILRMPARFLMHTRHGGEGWFTKTIISKKTCDASRAAGGDGS